MRDPVDREIRLALWKIHVLHHAAGRPVYGLWLMRELAEHGYAVSPGTLYPMLSRMERNGWLRSSGGGAKARRSFRITAGGKAVLEELRGHIAELKRELDEAGRGSQARARRAAATRRRAGRERPARLARRRGAYS